MRLWEINKKTITICVFVCMCKCIYSFKNVKFAQFGNILNSILLMYFFKQSQINLSYLTLDCKNMKKLLYFKYIIHIVRNDTNKHLKFQTYITTLIAMNWYFMKYHSVEWKLLYMYCWCTCTLSVLIRTNFS